MATEAKTEMQIYQYPGNCGAGIITGIYKHGDNDTYIGSLLDLLYKAKVDFSTLTWVCQGTYGDELMKELQDYGEEVIASEPFFSKHVSLYDVKPRFKAYVWGLSLEARKCLCDGTWTLKKGKKPNNNPKEIHVPDVSIILNLTAGLYPNGNIPQLEKGGLDRPADRPAFPLPPQVAVAQPDPPKEVTKRRFVRRLVAKPVLRKPVVKKKVKK